MSEPERVSTRVPPAAELIDVTTMLGDEPVLYRLCLRVRNGGFTVLMGPSGHGKSTLVRHLAGLLPPDRGVVRVSGRTVYPAGGAAVSGAASGAGALLGGSTLFDSSLFGSMTVLENVRYGLVRHGTPAAAATRTARYWLGAVGLADRTDAVPGDLPARARRRLALARTLALPTPLLLLDEVDLALDAAHRDAVIGALRRRVADPATTVLVTTHDLELATSLADTVAVLCHGRIVATGTPDEILHGVRDGDDFDRRFRVSDMLGPPRTEMVRATLDGPDSAEAGSDRRGRGTVDIPTLLLSVAALLAAATWILVLLLPR